MVSLSHKQTLIDDCVSLSYEIAVGTAFYCHCLKVLVGTALLDLKGALTHQLVTQIWKVQLRCIGSIPYKVSKLANDQQLNMSSKPWVFTSDTMETTLNIGSTCSLLGPGMHYIIICSTTPQIIFLKEVEDMSTAANMCLMQRRMTIDRGSPILEMFKSFAIVGVAHAVMGVGPSKSLESFYEILDRLPILFNCVSAPCCLALNFMANEIIIFLSNVATNDLVPGHLVYNDTMTLIMKVELKELCELIDSFSKLYVKLSLIAYFAFEVAWYKNKHNKKGLVSIVHSSYLIFYCYTRVIDKVYENWKYWMSWMTVCNLEDKLGLHGIDNDTIYVVWVQSLLEWMFYHEETIEEIQAVEVRMMKRTRRKKMLPLSWVQLIFVLQFLLSVQDISASSQIDTLEFSHFQIIVPLEVDSLNSQIFLTLYHGYCISGGNSFEFPFMFTHWSLTMLKLTAYTAQSFLASKLGLSAVLHLIVKGLQSRLQHTKAAIKLARCQLHCVSSWDHLGVIFSMIESNDSWLGLLHLYMLQFSKIQATHATKLAHHHVYSSVEKPPMMKKN